MRHGKGRIVRGAGGGSAGRGMMEALESRVLLSAAVAMAVGGAGGTSAVAGSEIHLTATAGKYDLVPSFTAAPKFTGALVAGQAVTGTLAVTITNAGTVASVGGRSVTAVLKPAGGGANVSVLAKPATVGAIAAKGKTTVTLNLAIPTTLKAGTYSFVVTADPGNTIGEPNNAVTGPFTITVASGVVTLSGSIVNSTLPTTIASGTATKAGVINVGVANLGNISTAQLPAVNVTVSLRPTAGGADIALFHQNNVKLPTLVAAAGGKATGKDTLTINVPALTAAQTALIPAGSYKIVVTVAPATTVLKVGSVTITGPTLTVTGKTSTGSIWTHGDTMTFTANTQLSGSNFLELGSFETNTGATGSYRFTPSGLALTYDKGGVDLGTFTFTGSQVFLDPVLNGVGKTVIFSASPAGAFMTGSVGGKTVYAKYA